MKIVIDIPKDVYTRLFDNGIQDNEIAVDDVCEMARALRLGTPLPEHHGRLKDIDAFISKVKADRKHSIYLRSWTADDVLNALDNSYAPTIIEGSEPDETRI